MSKQAETPWGEVKKAFKWILRSGVFVTTLSGLGALLTLLQNGEVDIRFFFYGVLILLTYMTANLIDYYNEKRK